MCCVDDVCLCAAGNWNDLAVLEHRERLVARVLHEARDRRPASEDDRDARLRPTRGQRKARDGRALEVRVAHEEALVLAGSEARSALALSGLPNSIRVFSHTQFGLSFTVVTYDDKSDVLQVRAQDNERLRGIDLPPGVEANIAPNATPVGEVMRYRLPFMVEDLPKMKQKLPAPINAK